MIGRTISHYRIVGQLGAGGMGVVYRAEDDRLGRAVALKVLTEELAHDRQAVDRLRAEARAASALNHANICAIYDIGDDEGRPFIVMELLKGRNLRDHLTSDLPRVHQLVDIGIQIADALDAAHGEGIIHRDIKPANIFLTDRHQVKLLDFGVAKLVETYTSTGTTGTPDLTAPGATVGTIAYMSPEQATGETLDGRTDLFSLGVVLYECATGRQPFFGKTPAVILSAILNRTPVAPIALNPELPIHLQEIINNCLEKNRELRYQSAADLRADLKRLRRDIESGQSRTVDTVAPRADTGSAGRQASGSVAARTPPPSTGEAHSTRNRRVAAATLVAAALIAAGAYALWPQRETRAPTTTTAPALSEADVQSRIDQAAAEISARLAAEQAKQAELAKQKAAASLPAPVPAPVPIPVPVPTPRAAAPAPPPPDAVPPTPTSAPAQVPPRIEPAPVPVSPPAATQPAPSAPVAAPPPPAPTPAAVSALKNDVPASPAGPSAEEDDAAIRRAVATYARAIENKDIALFRSVKPNLSREEQRRLEDGFRAVSKQSVNLTILSIDRKGQDAVVVLRRRDTIQAGGRQQQTESQQTLTLARTGNGWSLTEIR